MIISQTPLRISFVGGGTDLSSYYHLHDGMVISTSIDKYIYVIVKERFDELIVIHYTKNEIVNNINDIKHELIRESLIKVGITGGIEITTLGDIPSSGTGLGSSSSVTVGVLNALYNFIGEPITAKSLAEQACEIEIDILKKPIGKQDQYIASYGGLRKFIFHKDESVSVSNIMLNSRDRLVFGSNLLLHFTNITRNSESILNEQKNNNKIRILKQIADLVPELDKALLAKEFSKLGPLLKENWDLKRRLASGITRPEIETMAENAYSNGALGLKVAGAGGGGFLLSYVPRTIQDKYRKAMNKYPELPFMLDPFGSRIIFNILNYNAKII